jgi:hypothetical protein
LRCTMESQIIKKLNRLKSNQTTVFPSPFLMREESRWRKLMEEA